MFRKIFRASFTLAALGYIGAADAALGCNLPLRQGWVIAQTVAQNDDLFLPRGQALLHTLPHLLAGIPGIQLLQHIVIHRDHVHQRQGPALPCRLQRIRQRHFSLQLPLGPEIHENLVRYPLLTDT